MKGDTNGLKERDRGTQRQLEIGIQTDRATERFRDRETERQRDSEKLRKRKTRNNINSFFVSVGEGVMVLTLKDTKRNNKNF
jgi:hypothetical protein